MLGERCMVRVGGGREGKWVGKVHELDPGDGQKIRNEDKKGAWYEKGNGERCIDKKQGLVRTWVGWYGMVHGQEIRN